MYTDRSPHKVGRPSNAKLRLYKAEQHGVSQYDQGMDVEVLIFSTVKHRFFVGVSQYSF